MRAAQTHLCGADCAGIMPDHPHYYGHGWQPSAAASTGPTMASPSASAAAAEQAHEPQAAASAKAYGKEPQEQRSFGRPAAQEDEVAEREWEQWPQPLEGDAHPAQAANRDKENSR